MVLIQNTESETNLDESVAEQLRILGHLQVTRRFGIELWLATELIVELEDSSSEPVQQRRINASHEQLGLALTQLHNLLGQLAIGH